MQPEVFGNVARFGARGMDWHCDNQVPTFPQFVPFHLPGQTGGAPKVVAVYSFAVLEARFEECRLVPEVSKISSASSPACPRPRPEFRVSTKLPGGGLPRGRPTLICGSAGCGKTLLAMEFHVRGAMQFNEPGVFVAFEKTLEELTQNVRPLERAMVGLQPRPGESN